MVANIQTILLDLYISYPCVALPIVNVLSSRMSVSIHYIRGCGAVFLQKIVTTKSGQPFCRTQEKQDCVSRVFENKKELVNIDIDHIHTSNLSLWAKSSSYMRTITSHVKVTSLFFSARTEYC